MLRLLTAGESHGRALVGIIEGVPSNVELAAEYINRQLYRRQQGYGRGARMKIETDKVEILTGVRQGKTVGSPISLVIWNRDFENWGEKMAVESIEKEIERVVIARPGHADFVGKYKYAFDDIRNVIERASARETAMRVALSAVARKLLDDLEIKIGSHVFSIGTAGYKSREALDPILLKMLARKNGAEEISNEADKSEVRCLDDNISDKMVQQIKRAKKSGDTLGGIVEVYITGLPIGLGSYVEFDRKLDGRLAQAVMSIHAIKGVEIGEGFRNATKFGSEVHDEILLKGKRIVRPTNRAGGLEGGVTNGQPLWIRAAMKPISTLMKPLRSIDLSKMKAVQARRERSDFCAVPAAAVVAENIVAPVLADAILEKFGGDNMGELKERFSREAFFG
ncbi:MAG TPA: chorismate synthase [Candidatus Acidoferrales bacterium]|nr:chorismate synthase [Candidatus Acidoferrales bacterium]